LLSNNGFTGPIRDFFGSFQKLDFADFANNQFSGFLPSTLFDIPTIRIIYFSNNQFVGEIPPNYGRSPFLRDLYLYGNQLTGNVPPLTSGQLPNLTEFLIQDNDLSGEMPASVCALRTIGMLEDLWADCYPPDDPEIVCQLGCCTQCFPAVTGSDIEIVQ
jgi:hypothetical protein